MGMKRKLIFGKWLNSLGTPDERMAATVREHQEAEARCGRDWLTDGCACGACRIERRKLQEAKRSNYVDEVNPRWLVEVKEQTK